MKKILFFSITLLLTACSKQNTDANTATEPTKQTVELSNECRELLNTMAKLAEKDDAIAEQMQTNTKAFYDDWSQLNDEEKQAYSKKCANVNNSLNSLNESAPN